MIKVTIDRGNVKFEEFEGNGLTIMTELCCLVKAASFAVEDSTKEKGIGHVVVMEVAKALIANEKSGLEELKRMVSHGKN